MVVTVPLKAYQDVPVAPLAGKIVLDTNNYYWERDGRIPPLDEKRATTSGTPAGAPPRVHGRQGASTTSCPSDILTDGKPAGDADRRALATAGDSPEAVAFVTALYDEFGFDTVNVGSARGQLARGARPAGVRRAADPRRARGEPREGHALTREAHFPQR